MISELTIQRHVIGVFLLLSIVAISFHPPDGIAGVNLYRAAFTGKYSTATTPGLYWFQVGAWGASDSGWGDEFGPLTGASVEIRILTPQRTVHPDSDFAYWVGINLPNDAFIQVGYDASASNAGRTHWFWEYFPPGTASEASGEFLGKVGSVVGPNATWMKFSIASSGTTWSAFVGDQFVGSVDLKVSDSGTSGPYAVAEVAQTRFTDSILGPVEFRNLSYRDKSFTWHQVRSAVALCCYGAGSDVIPTGVQYPYGVESILGQNNHWVAGSGLPLAHERRRLWPWYKVEVSSPFGQTSGGGWYVSGESVSPSNTVKDVSVSSVERLHFAGWSANGLPSSASSFVVNSNLQLVALYSKQFFVSISSDYGTAYGSGWYDQNSQASIWVEPSTIKEQGILGFFGATLSFSGWEGDHARRDDKASVNVDSPKTIRAVWILDLASLMPISLVTAAIVGAVVLIFGTRRRLVDRSLQFYTSLLAIIKRRGNFVFCRECGARIPYDSVFCTECGETQQSK